MLCSHNYAPLRRKNLQTPKKLLSVIFPSFSLASASLLASHIFEASTKFYHVKNLEPKVPQNKYIWMNWSIDFLFNPIGNTFNIILSTNPMESLQVHHLFSGLYSKSGHQPMRSTKISNQINVQYDSTIKILIETKEIPGKRRRR